MRFKKLKCSYVCIFGALASLVWISSYWNKFHNGNTSNRNSPDNLSVKKGQDKLTRRDQLTETDTVILSKIEEGEYLEPEDAGKVLSVGDRKFYESGKISHSFNEYLSNRLSFHRSVPDTREERCESVEYPSGNYPTVSIVMCFYNEAASALLRSLHSILDRTPMFLIKEIILIDDFSDDPILKKPLEAYITQNIRTSIKIIRNEKREGLIRSRMIGAREAEAKVLLFLDSHIEVNTGWLEPLLDVLSSSTSAAVVPIIDIIDADSFQYKSSPLVRGGFTWTMRFSWEQIPPSELSEKNLYIKSPTMAGGIFAINREFFFQIGGYDTGMDIWGGENIEISLRLWMCGGSIQIALCSRVGHIFRASRPYSSPTGEDTLLKNTLRLVNVWLDDNKEKFYSASGSRYEHYDYGDITDRLELKKSLHCRNFSWYLENIYNPSNRLHSSSNSKIKPIDRSPKEQKSYDSLLSKGKMRVKDTNLCMLPHPIDGYESNSVLKLSDCSANHIKWYQLSDSSWVLDNQKYCLDLYNLQPTITKCTSQGGTQKWKLIPVEGKKDLVMYSYGTGLCLSIQKPATDGRIVEASTCDKAVVFTYKAK